MGSLFVAILLLTIVVSLFYRKDESSPKEKKDQQVLDKLKARYRQALQSGTKAQALQFGRDYYAYLRNSHTLPALDEEAIANDIAANFGR